MAYVFRRPSSAYRKKPLFVKASASGTAVTVNIGGAAEAVSLAVIDNPSELGTILSSSLLGFGLVDGFSIPAQMLGGGNFSRFSVSPLEAVANVVDDEFHPMETSGLDRSDFASSPVEYQLAARNRDAGSPVEFQLGSRSDSVPPIEALVSARRDAGSQVENIGPLQRGDALGTIGIISALSTSNTVAPIEETPGVATDVAATAGIIGALESFNAVLQLEETASLRADSADAVGAIVSLDSFNTTSQIETFSLLRGDGAGELEESVLLAAAEKGTQIEALVSPFRESSSPIEAGVGVRGEAASQIETFSLVAAADKTIQIEAPVSRRADFSSPAEVVPLLRTDTPAQIITLAALMTSDASIIVEALVGRARDAAVPIEEVGLALVTGDAPVALEVISVGSITADAAVPLEVLSVARSDAAVRPETIALSRADGILRGEVLAVLLRDNAERLEALVVARRDSAIGLEQTGGFAFSSDTNIWIESQIFRTADAVTPMAHELLLEGFNQGTAEETTEGIFQDGAALLETTIRNLTRDGAVQVEALGLLRFDRLGPLSSESAVQADRLASIETIAKGLSDKGAAAETAGSFSANAVFTAEVLHAVLRDKSSTAEVLAAASRDLASSAEEIGLTDARTTGQLELLILGVSESGPQLECSRITFKEDFGAPLELLAAAIGDVSAGAETAVGLASESLALLETTVDISVTSDSSAIMEFLASVGSNSSTHLENFLFAVVEGEIINLSGRADLFTYLAGVVKQRQDL